MHESGNGRPSDGGSSVGEWPAQRVGLFVDTQNLYYAARDGHGRHVDYARLLHHAARGRRVGQANAYVVERDGERAAFGFITKLSALGYRVHRRSVRVHRADDGGRPTMEGDWDMGIVADLVRAWEGLDVIVLASGDGDFVPILQLAQERGLRVEIAAFRAATAQTLIDAVDRFDELSEIEGIFVDAS